MGWLPVSDPGTGKWMKDSRVEQFCYLVLMWRNLKCCVPNPGAVWSVKVSPFYSSRNRGYYVIKFNVFIGNDCESK